MSRGRHLSLEEARKSGDLDQFAKEHPSTGKKPLFNKLLKAMGDEIECNSAHKLPILKPEFSHSGI